MCNSPLNCISVIKYLSHIVFVISEELRVTMSKYNVGLPFKTDEPTHTTVTQVGILLLII